MRKRRSTTVNDCKKGALFLPLYNIFTQLIFYDDAEKVYNVSTRRMLPMSVLYMVYYFFSAKIRLMITIYARYTAMHVRRTG